MLALRYTTTYVVSSETLGTAYRLLWIIAELDIHRLVVLLLLNVLSRPKPTLASYLLCQVGTCTSVRCKKGWLKLLLLMLSLASWRAQTTRSIGVWSSMCRNGSRSISLPWIIDFVGHDRGWNAVHGLCKGLLQGHVGHLLITGPICCCSIVFSLPICHVSIALVWLPIRRLQICILIASLLLIDPFLDKRTEPLHRNMSLLATDLSLISNEPS